MTGADALSWSIDTLNLGGDIRARYLRLQDWARALLVQQAAPGKPAKAP